MRIVCRSNILHKLRKSLNLSRARHLIFLIGGRLPTAGHEIPANGYEGGEECKGHANVRFVRLPGLTA